MEILAKGVEDVRPLRERLEREYAALRAVGNNVVALNNRESQMAGSRRYTGVAENGQWTYERNDSNSQLNAARADTNRAENDRKRIQTRIAQLEREIAEAENTMIASARTGQGQIIEIFGDSPAMAAAVESLQIGQAYRIEGAARIEEGTLRVRLRTATPVGTLP